VENDILVAIFLLIIFLGLLKLYFWFFFENGLTDLLVGPPPEDISDEELIEMGLERWVRRRNRWKGKRF
jgi:hypothetical protein